MYVYIYMHLYSQILTLYYSFIYIINWLFSDIIYSK